MRVFLLRTLVALAGVAAFGQQWANPVMPGDHPDPSVVRVGDTYFATVTSSGWAPIFPVLRSKDLREWEQIGSVFERRPEWSVSNYWAPEITYHGNRFYVYYTARRKSGPLCVAVATAERADGQWQDHGPLVCDAAGSIDAMAVNDEDGRRYLLWKEDGNSRKEPTPIYAQPLSQNGLRLVGERSTLIVNDAPWEGAVVEGPFVLRRDNYFYLFYAGGACCGTGCNYATGVARATRLLGPYEKNPANPILKAGGDWKCPGHGSLTTDPDGRTVFLYHAYPREHSIYLGREALLGAIAWNADGWPVVNAGRGPGAKTETEGHIWDSFGEDRLQPGWQWPPDNEPRIRIGGGVLMLAPRDGVPRDLTAAVLARQPVRADYSVVVVAEPVAPNTAAGLAAYGNERNALGLARTREALVLWRRENGSTSIVQELPLPASGPVSLRMIVRGGRRFEFAWSSGSRDWNPVPVELEGGYLPPWNLATRVVLTASGASEFRGFGMTAAPPAERRAAPKKAAAALALPPVLVRPAADGTGDDAQAGQPRAQVAAAPRAPALTRETFRDPPKRFRPWTVWWWFGNASTEADLLRELAEMDAHGIGGVEINCIYPLDLPDPGQPESVPIYSEAWNSRFRAVLAEARKRGMTVWLRGGSGWPFGGPNTPRAMSARALAQGTADVKGPAKFDVPKPVAPRAWTVDTIERLVAVENKTGERLVLSEPRVPAGAWRVHAFYRMFTNQQVKRAGPGGAGLVLDHFDSKALDEHLRPLEALAPLIRPHLSAFAGITSDSLELDDSNWTADFLEQFEKRRGYDLTRYLPDLFRRSNSDSDGVRQDFLQTLSDLQIERYFRHLSAWALRNGFSTSVQAHGGIADPLLSYGMSGVPDGETIWPGTERHVINLRNRVLAASAARIYDRPIVSAESYTWLRMPRFLVTLGMMKAASDALYLDGINHIKNHGYSSSPESAGRPGWVFYASTMINHNQTWWPHYPALAAYVTRMNWLMQSGERVAPVAIYSNIHDARAHFDAPKKTNAAWDGQDDAWHRAQDPGLDASARIAMEVGECADFLRRAGYGYDVVNDDAIRRGLAKYRALVFFRTRSTPPETLRALDAFRRRGGLVFAVERVPEEGAGLLRRAEQRVEIARLRAGIRPVATLPELRAALDKTVGPDFQAEPALGFLHRVLPDGRHAYFVANGSERSVTSRLWFRDALPGVEQWNPMDGSVTAARNPVTLEPWESTVFVFSETGAGWELPEPPREFRELALRWKVSFPEPVGRSYEWPQLEDWIDVPELRAVSGTATYSAEFEVPEDARDLVLELGDVRSSADVTVNGEPAGIVFLPPYRVSLEGLAKPGTNRVEVRVTNLWSNYIRSLPPAPSRLPGRGYGITDVLYGASERPLQSSGLLGPVRLLWRPRT